MYEYNIYDREGVPVPSASSDVLNFYFLSQKASNILKKGFFSVLKVLLKFPQKIKIKSFFL